MKKKVLPPNEIIAYLYKEKDFPMWKVAKELGCSVGYVHKTLHKCGVDVKEPHKGMLGKHKSPESIEATRRAHIGKFVCEETKNKISEAKRIHKEGHAKRRSDGYVGVYFPDHPLSTKDGYIMEHRLIMEKHIGRMLFEDEVVHHINKKRDDNRLDNLVLMTFKEHASLHMKERYLKRKGC